MAVFSQVVVAPRDSLLIRHIDFIPSLKTCHRIGFFGEKDDKQSMLPVSERFSQSGSEVWNNKTVKVRLHVGGLRALSFLSADCGVFKEEFVLHRLSRLKGGRELWMIVVDSLSVLYHFPSRLGFFDDVIINARANAVSLSVSSCEISPTI